MIMSSNGSTAVPLHASHPAVWGEMQRQYERLLYRLPWPGSDDRAAVRTLGVTSCHRGEGVSSVAAHLATVAASLGDYRVLLVDGNFAAPSVSRSFDVPNDAGFVEVCEMRLELADAVQSCHVHNLALLTAGQPREERDFASGRSMLPQLIRQCACDFDLTVFDLPAVELSTAALRAVGVLDGTVLVVEAGRVRRREARRTAESLVRAGARVVGTVLNKYERHFPRWFDRFR